MQFFQAINMSKINFIVKEEKNRLKMTKHQGYDKC